MNERVNSIVSSTWNSITLKNHTCKAIQACYDRLYEAIKNDGFTDLVAHTSARVKLASFFGSAIVKKAIGG